MKRLALVLAVAAGVLALAACGGNDDPPSETEQIREVLINYGKAIDSEDYDAVCGYLAPEVLAIKSCDEIKQGFQALATAAGSSDAHARITPGEITFFANGGFAAYEVCVSYTGPETCTVEEVHMTKVTGTWLIGNKVVDTATPSPAAS